MKSRFMRDKPREVRRNYILRVLFTASDRKHFTVFGWMVGWVLFVCLFYDLFV